MARRCSALASARRPAAIPRPLLPPTPAGWSTPRATSTCSPWPRACGSDSASGTTTTGGCGGWPSICSKGSTPGIRCRWRCRCGCSASPCPWNCPAGWLPATPRRSRRPWRPLPAPSPLRPGPSPAPARSGRCASATSPPISAAMRWAGCSTACSPSTTAAVVCRSATCSPPAAIASPAQWPAAASACAMSASWAARPWRS